MHITVTKSYIFAQFYWSGDHLTGPFLNTRQADCAKDNEEPTMSVKDDSYSEIICISVLRRHNNK